MRKLMVSMILVTSYIFLHADWPFLPFASSYMLFYVKQNLDYDL